MHHYIKKMKKGDKWPNNTKTHKKHTRQGPNHPEQWQLGGDKPRAPANDHAFPLSSPTASAPAIFGAVP